ncbi:hypothetical protein ACETU7_05175 [Rhodococcus sp. 3Y1]
MAALNERLGLNQPLLVQYWNWVVSALHGDLGTSLQNSAPSAHRSLRACRRAPSSLYSHCYCPPSSPYRSVCGPRRGRDDAAMV